VEIYFNHAVNDLSRMQNQEWWEFTELAKRQGKIRFRGMSGHGGHLVECLDYAIDKDLVDVILVSYSFGQDPKFTDKVRHTFHWAAIQTGLPRVLEKAKRKDVGVVAMKTLMGGRLNDMRPYERPGGTFAQAAFRWVLSSPHVDALVVSMTSKACAESCPVSVPIAEVLRTRMYAVDYGDATLARTEYAGLGEGATACLTCAHRACLSACPAGVPIAKLTRDAAVRLG